MAKEVLTPLQKKFLSVLSKNRYISGNFYLTGGTALAAYYLKHRYSEDLDFFSEKEIDLLSIDIFLKDIRPALGIKKIDFQQSFNRNIFFIHTKREILKMEFTYFPFHPIKDPDKISGIRVNSLTDIAVDKAFTISQNPRARDFVDLYCVLKLRKDLSFEKLVKTARAKFDWQIDPIQLGAQLIKAGDIKDLPRMIKKLNHRAWRDFFVSKAGSLSADIFK